MASAPKTALQEYASTHGIKYFLVSFVDLFGVVRSKLVPSSAIAQMEKDGAGFAGFATYLDMTAAHPDMFAIPDPASVMPVPWREGLAWVASDLVMEGKPVMQAPRNVLKAQIEKAREAGYEMKTGVECEFFLLSSSSDLLTPLVSDPADVAKKPCYEQGSLMRRYDVVSEICDYMQHLGWKPYQNDHEDANGQFEMNWEYDHCLTTADRHVFFKFMVKSVAEKHGLRATFMPKPFKDRTGNGAHIHVSLWKGEENVFHDEDGTLGLSSMAYSFIGGVIENGGALCAITNPAVNSYKRLSGTTTSGSSWAPQTISYTGNNRTHMIRIPDAGRFEFRLPDGAANPYLLQAGVLAAGMLGMEKNMDPGPRCDWNGHLPPPLGSPALKRLPSSLEEAVRLLESSELLKEALGAEFAAAYAKLKLEQWREYCGHLSPWEMENTLDC